MSPVYDGGHEPRPEDEIEQEAWSDPLDGEMPGQPARTAETPEEWKPRDWSGGPEEKMWRDKMNNDDAADGA